ncbi:putative intracellular protease/amidase [Oxalobacteraceae bacterium GrIS 1.11]
MRQPLVLIALPGMDFDPTEVAISWQTLQRRGVEVVFASPDGQRATPDALMLDGEGLDVWGAIPLLKKIKLLGLLLRANGDARAACAAMQAQAAFRHPLAYADLKVSAFDGLILPGGHRARGIRPYLENPPLQRFVGDFFDSGKPVGAICHGVVLAARSTSRLTGKSSLYGRKSTALGWEMEHKAWLLMRLAGRFWDAAYYRTYLEQAGEPAGHRSVQAEATRALASPADFIDVAGDAPHFLRKSGGLLRDSADDSRPAWVVTDGNYVSARWPGDAHAFAAAFAALLTPARQV